MMTPRERVIECARSCLGTPFRHQGRVKGLGLDCVGLVRIPVMELEMPAYKTNNDFRQYGREPVPSKMNDLLLNYFDEVPKNQMKPGDILWFKIRQDPQHLGILTADNTVVHAVANVSKRVVEHTLDQRWRDRIVKVFRYRGIDD